MSCSVRYSCPNAITTLSTRIPLFFFTAIASGRLSSCPVVKLLSTERSGRGQAVAGRDAEAESVERESGLRRAQPPDRRRGGRIELRRRAALQLPEVPPGVHQGEVGQRHVRPDAQHLLREPEREGVVVARGDQDPVGLHRLEHVDGQVAGQVLVGAAGAGVVAGQRHQRDEEDRGGVRPAFRFGAGAVPATRPGRGRARRVRARSGRRSRRTSRRRSSRARAPRGGGRARGASRSRT